MNYRNNPNNINPGNYKNTTKINANDFDFTPNQNFVNEEVSEYDDNEFDDENNGDEGEDDSEEELQYDPAIFTDINPEYVKFKKMVKEWVALDDDIKLLNTEMKKRKKKKDELTPTILNFMQRFHVNDLNTQNGHLKYTTNLTAKPVNKKFLLNKLGDFFNDTEKGEKLTNYLFENREKTEKINLKRVVKKKNLTID